MKFSTKAVSLAFFYLASTVSAVVPDDGVSGQRCEDQDWNTYAVGFKDRASYDAFLATGVQTAGVGVSELNTIVLQFDSEEEATAFGADQPDVDYVEKDGPVCATEMTSSAETTPYGISMVNALDIPDYDASSNIKMCVIDSGYQRHEDLPNDNNGDPVTGKGLCDSGCSWDTALSDHGNHVAGTIAGIGGNRKGVVGVVRNKKMPLHIVRVFEVGSGSFTAVSNALLDCDNVGGNVANMSLGGNTGSAPSVIQRAVNTILGRNDQFLMIAAAGNSGNTAKSYPASMPEMMSVASVDSSKKRSYFSQYNDEVDIAGPGSSVLSTVFDNAYSSFSGTSMATPHVAGVAAKVWSHFPTKTAQEIRDVLESTAEDLGKAGRDDMYGHGLVNAKAAYDKLGSTNPPPTPPPASSPTSSPTASTSCEDSPLEILVAKFKKSAKACSWIPEKRPELCDLPRFASHCPASCNACKQYGSADSRGRFVYNQKVRDCAWVKKQACENYVFFAKLMKIKNIMKTCRRTVGLLFD